MSLVQCVTTISKEPKQNKNQEKTILQIKMGHEILNMAETGKMVKDSTNAKEEELFCPLSELEQSIMDSDMLIKRVGIPHLMRSVLKIKLMLLAQYYLIFSSMVCLVGLSVGFPCLVDNGAVMKQGKTL